VDDAVLVEVSFVALPVVDDNVIVDVLVGVVEFFVSAVAVPVVVEVSVDVTSIVMEVSVVVGVQVEVSEVEVRVLVVEVSVVEAAEVAQLYGPMLPDICPLAELTV
jgi:hypothetical protein